MSRIWSMMDVGRRSMANSQTALQTTAHNIANKTTEGYSRQRVDLVSNDPVGEGKLRIGMGAKAGSVVRTNNEYIEKQIQREGGELGFVNSKAEMLGRVEQVYNEQQTEGLNHSIGNFFNSFRELSSNPESLAARTAVRESASGLANDFKKVNGQLREIGNDADFRIATKVEQVNQITKEIAVLNEKVSNAELGGLTANDERDRRDLLLKNLSEKINIRYGESKEGVLTITAGNTALLVSGFSQRDLKTAPSPAREGKGEGTLDIIYTATEHSTPAVVTGQMTGGEIGGLLEARDKGVGDLQKSMDKLAFALTTEVNQVHVNGYDRNGRTQNLLFEQPMDEAGAAQNMAVDAEVLADVSRIAAAGQADAPGDNRIANILSGLEYRQVMENDSASFGDFYNAEVGRVGIETQRANASQQSQTEIVGQLKNIRESISGVSLDEETTKMIEFQKAFEASARLVKTADEMLDTVLRLKQM